MSFELINEHKTMMGCALREESEKEAVKAFYLLSTFCLMDLSQFSSLDRTLYMKSKLQFVEIFILSKLVEGKVCLKL